MSNLEYLEETVAYEKKSYKHSMIIGSLMISLVGLSLAISIVGTYIAKQKFVIIWDTFLISINIWLLTTTIKTLIDLRSSHKRFTAQLNSFKKVAEEMDKTFDIMQHGLSTKFKRNRKEKSIDDHKVN